VPSQTHAIKIDNPLANPHSPIVTPEVINLMIDFDGALLWSKQPLDRITLQGYISQRAAVIPQPEVHITVETFASYEIVAQTLAG